MLRYADDHLAGGRAHFTEYQVSPTRSASVTAVSGQAVVRRDNEHQYPANRVGRDVGMLWGMPIMPILGALRPCSCGTGTVRAVPSHARARSAG